MREIKFRGKSIATNKLVYGYYFYLDPHLTCFATGEKQKGQAYILSTGFADWHMPRPIEKIEVYPDTVGQYTGMKDMDGQEIYDGDILEELIAILNENKELEQLEPRLHFMEWYIDDTDNGWTVWPCECWYAKVIGNKHSSPDLWASRPMAEVENDRERNIKIMENGIDKG